jgi:cytochrome c551/c552
VRRLTAAFAALAASAALLCGCGGSGESAAHGAGTESVPAYVTEPFSRQEQLVAQGAHLAVADGCTACHLSGAGKGVGPSFSSFAGHTVKLVDGRSAVVDESYVRTGLADPRAAEIKGYNPAPMLAALARAHLSAHPTQIAALAAFIEQVGPESQ